MRVVDDNATSIFSAYTPKKDYQSISTNTTKSSIIDKPIEYNRPFSDLVFTDPFRYRIKFKYNKELDIYVKHEIDTQNIYRSKQVPSKEQISLMTIKKGLFELTEKLMGR